MPSPQPNRGLPYKPDPNHDRYEKYDPSAIDSKDLPPLVDLRPHMTPVENQKQLESCTANALVGAYEYLEKRVDGDVRDISRLFIYYNERAKEGTVDKNVGCHMSDGVNALKTLGACTEDTWPYDVDAFENEPTAEAFKEAAEHKIDDAFTVPIDLNAMKVCLAEGYPFVFAIYIYKSFAPDKQGKIPMPTPPADTANGGHALLCVGYSDEDQCFLVRNSWGPDWGLKGYCLIPYAYLTDPKFCHDPWTIRRSHDLDFSQGTKGGALPHGAKVSFLSDAEDEEDDEDEDGEDDDDSEDGDAEDGDAEDGDAEAEDGDSEEDDDDAEDGDEDEADGEDEAE